MKRAERFVSLLAAASFFMLNILCAFANEKTGEIKKFAVKELQDDFLQLREAMEHRNSILYEFTEKSVFHRLFEDQFSKIDRPMSLAEFYRIISPVVAKIGCGHSAAWLPKGYWKNNPVKLLPLRLVFLEGKAYAWYFYRNVEGVPEGTEILSINGHPIPEILEALKRNISADAYMDSRRLYKINQAPSFFYGLGFGYPDKFEFAIRLPYQDKIETLLLEAVDLQTVEKAQFEVNTTEYNPLDFTLDLEILENKNTAVLTIRSFVYYENPEKFNGFIDEAFEKIHMLGIKSLILDLRNNGGGNPFCTSHLFSYLIRTPLPYFAAEYGKYARLAQPIVPAENAFQGRLITLINGGCFSSTPHFCALLKYHKIGNFVGTEAGGTYTCNGATNEITLENTGFIVGICRKAFAAAVEGFPKHRGILPDHTVMPQIDDLIHGRDAQKEYALALIDKFNSSHRKISEVNMNMCFGCSNIQKLKKIPKLSPLF